MLNTVLFVSKAAFEKHIKATSRTIAISIGCDTEPAPRLNRGFAGVIRLNFDDAAEGNFGLEPGALPDLHPRHAAGVRIIVAGDELCDFNDALKVKRFLDTYANKPEGFDLVVHCQAGISRSAAVAQFAAGYYGAIIENASPDTSGANQRFLRLLNKAADEAEPTCFAMPEDILEFRKERYTSKLGVF